MTGRRADAKTPTGSAGPAPGVLDRTDETDSAKAEMIASLKHERESLRCGIEESIGSTSVVEDRSNTRPGSCPPRRWAGSRRSHGFHLTDAMIARASRDLGLELCALGRALDAKPTAEFGAGRSWPGSLIVGMRGARLW
jgi:hypothetical protein